MNNKYLYNVLPFLKSVGTERQEQFEYYFRNAPLWILDALRVEEYEAGRILTHENGKADTIYFVGSGKVKVTDYRVSGISYDFMKPSEMIAFGGMETIMEIDTYRATIRAQTDCIVVKLARRFFEKWIYSDIEALRLESKITCTYLLEEERRNRLYLFLQGSDRLALLFVELYEKYSRNGLVCIRESRQELADETGLCIKSISRSVKKFLDEGLITKEGNRILIEKVQYEKIRAMVDEKMEH